MLLDAQLVQGLQLFANHALKDMFSLEVHAENKQSSSKKNDLY